METSVIPTFVVGDAVKVIIENEQQLIQLQEGHGGWNTRMARLMGKVGKIHRRTENGDYRVKFPESQLRWTFNPVALEKVPAIINTAGLTTAASQDQDESGTNNTTTTSTEIKSTTTPAPLFRVGDVVRLLDDEDRVKLLQVGHGDWVDEMRLALGKKGKVIQVYDDRDLRVTITDAIGIERKTLTLNPRAVTLITDHQSTVSTTTTTKTTTTSLPVTPATTSSNTPASNCNNSVDNTTSGISELLRQVQLRDTKFKCSRGDAGLHHPQQQTSSSSSSSQLQQQQHHRPDMNHNPHHHHHHHHHANGFNPAWIRNPASCSSQSASSSALGHHHNNHSHNHNRPSFPGAGRGLSRQQQQLLVSASVVSSPTSSSSTSSPGTGTAVTTDSELETVEMLKSKIAAMEDMIMCNICMERKKNVAFLCGHGSCFFCSQSLTNCHMCRLPIQAKINLY